MSHRKKSSMSRMRVSVSLLLTWWYHGITCNYVSRPRGLPLISLRFPISYFNSTVLKVNYVVVSSNLSRVNLERNRKLTVTNENRQYWYVWFMYIIMSVPMYYIQLMKHLMFFSEQNQLDVMYYRTNVWRTVVINLGRVYSFAQMTLNI